MWGLSCPTASFCGISAARGKIITVEDPFSADPATGRKKKRRRAPKRPKTTIALAPEPANRTSGGVFKARFRFFANGRVRRFVCRIDRRKARSCHSPKLYRLGAGKHIFRVRAIGITGLKGPIATDTSGSSPRASGRRASRPLTPERPAVLAGEAEVDGRALRGTRPCNPERPPSMCYDERTRHGRTNVPLNSVPSSKLNSPRACRRPVRSGR